MSTDEKHIHTSRFPTRKKLPESLRSNFFLLSGIMLCLMKCVIIDLDVLKKTISISVTGQPEKISDNCLEISLAQNSTPT